MFLSPPRSTVSQPISKADEKSVTMSMRGMVEASRQRKREESLGVCMFGLE